MAWKRHDIKVQIQRVLFFYGLSILSVQNRINRLKLPIIFTIGKYMESNRFCPLRRREDSASRNTLQKGGLKQQGFQTAVIERRTDVFDIYIPFRTCQDNFSRHSLEPPGTRRIANPNLLKIPSIAAFSERTSACTSGSDFSRAMSIRAFNSLVPRPFPW